MPMREIMADEIKDQRIITLMTPTEVKAIDDWMFANRVRSRGEAIRRLCQIGMRSILRFSAVSEALAEALAKSHAVQDEWNKHIDEYHAKRRDLGEYAREVAVMFSTDFPEIYGKIIESHNLLVDYALEIGTLTEDMPLSEALQKADQAALEAAERQRAWALEELEAAQSEE